MTADLPAGLAAALAERGAPAPAVEAEGARRYVSAGAWFGRFTTDPADEPALAFEVDVRAMVGSTGALRAPEIVASGPGWTLERAVPRHPPAGAADVAATVAAALAIPALELPAAPPGTGVERSGDRWRRRARMLAGGARPGDLLRARSLPDLPLVTSHGDFHAGNVLCDGDGPWIVDWELTGQRPLGYDLLTLWPTLADPADREIVLAAAVEQAGPGREADVLRLRDALLVRALVAVAGVERGVGSVGLPAAELRELLRDARAGRSR